MIPLKYAKTGNSMCLVLSKDAVAELGAVRGDTVYLTRAPDGTATLTPYDPTFDRQLRIAHEGMAKYRNALRALAGTGEK